jgi:hypothetical protein
MDLNIYNIHYVVVIFGKPRNVEYYPKAGIVFQADIEIN